MSNAYAYNTKPIHTHTIQNNVRTTWNRTINTI